MLLYATTAIHCCYTAAAAIAGGKLKLDFNGSAGQSFGAFTLNGMHIKLQGEANDYVGKGMNGGVIAITPPARAGFTASENVIIGNTCLYGATGGKLFAQVSELQYFNTRTTLCTTIV
jgi:glutamate synthase (ferredoxin)